MIRSLVVALAAVTAVTCAPALAQAPKPAPGTPGPAPETAVTNADSPFHKLVAAGFTIRGQSVVTADLNQDGKNDLFVLYTLQKETKVWICFSQLNSYLKAAAYTCRELV